MTRLLCRGETHKNDVLMFCQRQAKLCKEDVDMIDRDSAELLWKFLEMLIKQNGVSFHVDKIAEGTDSYPFSGYLMKTH